MLNFKVQNQIINRTDSFRAVADSKNYLKASFELSDEWEGSITAVFIYGDRAFHQPLENGECVIPWEVIKAPFFTVSVFCGNLITSNVEYVAVEASGFKNGEVPETPTPTIWQRYIDELAEKNSEILDGKLSEVTSAANAYADNLAEEIKGAQVGKKTEQGGEIFNDYENNYAGPGSSARGSGVDAFGKYADGKGVKTTAGGYGSSVEGEGTIAAGDFQHVQGKYNEKDSEGRFAHIVGGGTADEARKNIHTLDWNGAAWFKSGVKVGGTSPQNSYALETTSTAGIRYNNAIKTAKSYAETAEKNAKTYTDEALAGKVDKVEGKGLSTEDYTTAEKTKLSELPTNAVLEGDLTSLSNYATSVATEKANKAYQNATAYASREIITSYNNAISTAQTYANTAEQNAKNYVDGRLDKEFELLAEVEITETGISNVTVKKDQNNQALRLKKIFVDCTLAPIDDNEEGSTTYQSGQFSVALFLDNSNTWSFWSLTNVAWKVGTTNYVPLYYWIENKKPMGIMCTATAATYNAAAMGFPVNASQYSEAAEVITGISLNVGSSTLPDMPVGTKFKIWGVKE